MRRTTDCCGVGGRKRATTEALAIESAPTRSEEGLSMGATGPSVGAELSPQWQSVPHWQLPPQHALSEGSPQWQTAAPLQQAGVESPQQLSAVAALQCVQSTVLALTLATSAAMHPHPIAGTPCIGIAMAASQTNARTVSEGGDCIKG